MRFSGDIETDVKGILKARGFDNWMNFVYPTEEDVETRQIKNIDKASEMLLKHINNGSKIVILVDSDVDGVTSSALMYDGIKEIGNYLQIKTNVQVINHEKKVHGLNNVLYRLEGKYDKIDLFIAPDSSTNDVEGMLELGLNGIDVIVLDHHPKTVEDKDIPKNTVLVTNAEGGISSGLSGVGVVYKLLEYIDKQEWMGFIEDYRDILSMGLLGDNMSCINKEVNFYVRDGLKNIKNKFIKNVLKIKDGEVAKIHSILFEVNPKLNATFRNGSLEDKKMMFKAMSRTKKEEWFKNNRAKAENGLVPTAHHFKLLAMRLKSLEKRKIESVDFEKVNLSSNGMVAMFDISGTELTLGISGMLSGSISKKFNVPAIVYSGKTMSGSCRSPIDVKDVFVESGEFDWCRGHQRAFGISLNKNFDIDKIGESIKEYDNSAVADIEIESSKINVGMITYISTINSNIYSNSCAKVTLGTKIKVDPSDVYINEKRTMLSINRDGFNFILFNPSDDDIESMKNGEVRIITEPSVSTFGGKVSFKLIITNVF